MTTPESSPSTINRRSLLIGAAGLAVGAIASPLLLGATSSASLVTQPNLALPCKLYTTGREGRRFKGSADIYDQVLSVITELDLQTGNIRQVSIPVGEAHYVFAVPEHDTLCVTPQNYAQAALLDMDLKLKRLLATPAGYLFSGHGTVSRAHNVAFITFYASPENKEMEGLIIAYDLETFKEVGRYGSGGVKPHDMSFFPDGTRIAMAHAGVGSYGEAAKNKINYTQHPPEFYLPKLSIFDTQSQKIVQTMDLRDQIPLLHLAVNSDDQVYAVLQQYISHTGNDADQKNKEDAQTYFGKKLAFSLSELETTNKMEAMAVPLPLMHFDTKANHISKIFTSNQTQRRSQSVAFQSKTGITMATYVFSETLVCVPMQGKAYTLHTPTQFDIQNPIALCDIPGTPYYALGGMYDDIAIIDARDHSLVHRYQAPLYRSSHFTPLMV